MSLGYDGSIRINTKIDTSDFSKGLAKMSADMEKQAKSSEKALENLTKKREQAQKALYDAEKKREELFQRQDPLEDQLESMRARLAEAKKQAQEYGEIAEKFANPAAFQIKIEAEEQIKRLEPEIEKIVAQISKFGKAFDRVNDEIYKQQQAIKGYDEEIEKANAALEQQRAEAERISASLEDEQRNLEQINQTAEVGNQRIIDLSHRLAELQDRQRTLQAAGLGLGYQEFDENERAIHSITEELRRYQSELRNTEEQQQQLQGFLGTLQRIGEYLGGSFGENISAAASSLSAFSGKIAVVVAVVKAVYDALKVVAEKFKEIVSKIASVTSSIAKVLGSGFSKSFSAIKKSVSTLVKSLSDATKSIVKFSAENNAIAKVSEIVHSKLERLGNMIRRVFVFSVITSGLRSLRSELSSYLQLNEQFSNALRTLQGVLLTAFQPIYDAVLPALTALINFLAKAIAVVSQFTATLFGTTAKKSQKNAEALYKQAHAVEAVGGAAKKAAKEAEVAVAAFDEFNILSFPKENDGGGGGGAGGGVEIPNFEYEYEDFPFDSWGEAFSAFLDKLLAGLPKLEDAFKKFADWLNDLSKKLYDMFTFPGVLDKVKSLGKGLAEALNKLVNLIDWNQLGKALGAGLNLALNFLTSFLYAFDWMNLGRKLAEFVNGLVSEIDWYEFGRLLWAGFKIALETLAGFILGLDMPLMAKALSDTIRGFFDEMYNTVQRIPWYKIGEQIATFFNNIDWYGSITVALKAISAAIEALFEMLDGFVRSLHWGDIAKKIYTAINDSLGLIDWRNIGQTLGNAFVQVFEFARQIITGIDWHLIGENIADLILGFDFVSALSSLGQLIAAGVNAAVRLACGYLDKVTPELKAIAKNLADGLRDAITAVDWTALGNVIGRGIKGALTLVSGLLDKDLFYTIGRSIGDFLIALDWVGIVGGLTEVLAKAIGAAVAAVRGFLDSVTPHIKEIATGIADKINQFFRDVDWKEVGRTISDGLKSALLFMVNLIEQINWTAIGKAVVDLFSGIDWAGLFAKVVRLIVDVFLAGLLAAVRAAAALTKIFDIGNEIVRGLLLGIGNAAIGIVKMLYNSLVKPLIDGVKNLLGIHSPSKVFEEIGKNIVEGLIQGIKGAWSGVLEFLKEKINAIVDFFNSAWDGIKEKTAAAWESIKNTLLKIWDNLKESASKSFEGIRKKILDAWDKLKEKTKAVWDGIKTTLTSVWDNLKSKCKDVFDKIKEAIQKTWDTIKSKTSEIWENIKTTLSTLWENLKTTAQTIFENIKTIIFTVWENIKSKTTEIWNNIKSFLSTLWDKLKTTAKTVFDAIKTAIVTAWENVKSKTTEIWNSIKTTLTNLWNELKNTVIRVFTEIKNKIIEMWTAIKNDAVAKWNEIKNTISEKVNQIKQVVSEGFSRVKETIVGKVNEAMNALRNGNWASIGSSIVNGLLSGLNSIFSKISNWASQVKNSLSNAISGFNQEASRFGNFGGGNTSGGGFSKMAAAPQAYAAAQIPKLANGAVIPPNQQFLAILGDQRRGVNVEAPLATIKQALAETMREMGGMSGDIYVTVESVLDGRIVARNTVKHINDMTRSAGKPVLLF